MKTDQKTKKIAKRKQELYERSSKYKSALNSDINELKLDVGRLGRNFLVIAGTLYVAYKITKIFRSTKTEEVTEAKPQAVQTTRESSALALKIKEQIALFLLALAFKKLKDFLNDKQNDKTPS